MAPVAAAFVRRTDSVPSATQKPCWTLITSATATAAASATAPRMLLTNQTERKLAWVCAAVATLDTRCKVRAAAVDPVYHRRRLRLEPLGVSEPGRDQRLVGGADDGHGDPVGVERDLGGFAEFGPLATRPPTRVRGVRG